MGIVFVFLTVMVFALQFQAKIIDKYFSNEKSSTSLQTQQPTKSKEPENDNKIVAAITAAIMHHNYLKLKG